MLVDLTIPFTYVILYNGGLREVVKMIDSKETLERNLEDFKKELAQLESGIGAYGFKLNLKGRYKQFHKDRIEAVKSYITLMNKKLKELKGGNK